MREGRKINQKAARTVMALPAHSLEELPAGIVGMSRYSRREGCSYVTPASIARSNYLPCSKRASWRRLLPMRLSVSAN
jgi:hypothetical protein